MRGIGKGGKRKSRGVEEAAGKRIYPLARPSQVGAFSLPLLLFRALDGSRLALLPLIIATTH
jgi:hypothetical protein